MNFIRPWLAVGTYRDVFNRALLEQYSIQATLQFVENVRYEGIASCYLPIDDGVPVTPKTLRKGVDFITEQYHEGRIILSACGAGVSRSVIFAAAALKEIEELSLLEATTEVMYFRPEALPNPIVMRSVCTYYGEPFSHFQLRERLDEKKATARG
jgi:protein-tyrosine phosphatase